MLTLKQQQKRLEGYQANLCKELDLELFRARNSAADKWKVTYRVLLIRELASWRFCDLMKQSFHLQEFQYYAGSGILIRAALEALALMVFCAGKMETIMRTGDGFHQFSDKTVNLLFGSKSGQTDFNAVNVNDFLKETSKSHPRLLEAYNLLSETTHPNFDGLSRMYSSVCGRTKLTTFLDKPSGSYKDLQRSIVSLMFSVFEKEYNDRWINSFEMFEIWIMKNDKKLELSQPSSN